MNGTAQCYRAFKRTGFAVGCCYFVVVVGSDLYFVLIDACAMREGASPASFSLPFAFKCGMNCANSVYCVKSISNGSPEFGIMYNAVPLVTNGKFPPFKFPDPSAFT